MDSSIPDGERNEQTPGLLMHVGQISAEFKRLRLAQALPQVRVAHELGITQAALSAWETGKSKSLRAPTLDKAIQLIDTWRANSNILLLPGDRTKPAITEYDKPARRRRSESKERSRQRMIEEIKSKVGPERPSAEVLSVLSWNDLFDIYVLSKIE